MLQFRSTLTALLMTCVLLLGAVPSSAGTGRVLKKETFLTNGTTSVALMIDLGTAGDPKVTIVHDAVYKVPMLALVREGDMVEVGRVINRNESGEADTETLTLKFTPETEAKIAAAAKMLFGPMK